MTIKNMKLKKSVLSVSGLLLLASSQLFGADAYDIIEIKNTALATEANPNPEYNATFAYDINNNGVVVGHIVYPEFSQDTDNDGVIELISRSYAEAFIFTNIDNTTSMTGLGSIDNSVVNVEITNNGETETVNVGKDINDSLGFSINQAGLVAGTSFVIEGQISEANGVQSAVSSSASRAVRYDTNQNEPLVVPSFNSDDTQNMRGLGLNDNGLIVGFGLVNPDDDFDDDGNPIEAYFNRGFIYDNNTMSLIQIDPTSEIKTLKANVIAVNNNNMIVGVAQKVVEERVLDGLYHYSYTPTQEIDPNQIVNINVFGNESGFATPNAINESDVIVGRALSADDTRITAFSYDANSQTSLDLGQLNGIISRPFSEALGINVNNSTTEGYQVVGRSKVSTVVTGRSSVDVLNAFIYENGAMKNLNSLIDCNIDTGKPDWVLTEARAINDSGIIVGNGIYNGINKAFMLIPREATPPQNCKTESVKGSGSTSLHLLSLLALVSFSRRKKHKTV
jgi:hypothetical protein